MHYFIIIISCGTSTVATIHNLCFMRPFHSRIPRHLPTCSTFLFYHFYQNQTFQTEKDRQAGRRSANEAWKSSMQNMKSKMPPTNWPNFILSQCLLFFFSFFSFFFFLFIPSCRCHSLNVYSITPLVLSSTSLLQLHLQ